eukprot:CCRYP_013890-RA/>CCRYP_013890-RA protein AED:0.12 eAED:0.12 QI:0/-1/0/1/-1/1/1/0/279
MDGHLDKECTVFGYGHRCEQASPPIEESSSPQFHPSRVEEGVNQCRGDRHPNDEQASAAAVDFSPPSLEIHKCEDFVSQKDGIGDAAAIFVWLYLLLVSSLLVGAVVIGSLVIVKYGFVIFVAVVAAAGVAVIVAGTFISVIRDDAMLTNARSKVNAWHVVVKDAILEELHHFTNDLTAYSDGTLLLTYGQTEESSSYHENKKETFEQDLHNQSYTTTFKRKPKSLIFRFVVSPITKLGNHRQKSSSRTTSRSWLRKKKKNGMSSGNVDSASGYVPPIV